MHDWIYTAEMLFFAYYFVLSSILWTACKVSTFIKVNITSFRIDKFLSFFFPNKQERVLVKYMLYWNFECHLFVVKKKVTNSGQLFLFNPVMHMMPDCPNSPKVVITSVFIFCLIPSLYPFEAFNFSMLLLLDNLGDFGTIIGSRLARCVSNVNINIGFYPYTDVC